MKWLITGAGGMLGRDMNAALVDHPGVVSLTRDALDITSLEAVNRAIQIHRPDVIVNCAGYTAVDAAETDEATAFAVNAAGPANLARAAVHTGSRLVHVSTDYVFDGTASAPYAEDAPLSPWSAYGRTKAAGEWAVRAHLPDCSWIVRTAWLYGAGGRNFVTTMIKLEAEQDVVDVVADQWGQPTWSASLARQIVRMVSADAPHGVYHGTAAGWTSWFELAREIFALRGADPARVRASITEEHSRPAGRPAYSVLGHEAWRRCGLEPLEDWRSMLAVALADMGLSERS